MVYTVLSVPKEQQVLVQKSERKYSISARSWQKFIADLRRLERQRFFRSS